MPARVRLDPSLMTVRCELQRRMESVAATGEVVVTWQPYCLFWAHETVQTPRQFASAEAMLGEARRVFRTHRIDGVRMGDRVRVHPGMHVYDVVGASDPDGTRAYTDIYCVDQQHAD